MDVRFTIVKNYIEEKLKELSELGKTYSEEKINTLAKNLSETNKNIDEIKKLIDNKFSYQARKIAHNQHLATLKEYYLSNIDKLKKGNNCYLLSYDEGIKVLEQASIKEIKQIDEERKLVSINKTTKGFTKTNNSNNDYELIISDIAYLLGIDYAKTYRIFDENMNPNGILNQIFTTETERFLNIEETLQFIKEESSKFVLKQEIINYHDKHVRHGINKATNLKEYKENIEYMFKLFACLPDITKKNIEKLKKEYLNLLIFELVINSLNNNYSSIGIIVNKEKQKYTYRLSLSYNQYVFENPKIKEQETIVNFYILDKEKLLHILVSNYYNYVKELSNLIYDNKITLEPLIDKVIGEHLEYDEYDKYHKVIKNNIKLLINEVESNKQFEEETEEDKNQYNINNQLYDERISPFVENYVADEYEDEKGSAALVVVVAVVLLITILLILGAVYAISKVEM